MTIESEEFRELMHSYRSTWDDPESYAVREYDTLVAYINQAIQEARMEEREKYEAMIKSIVLLFKDEFSLAIRSLPEEG